MGSSTRRSPGSPSPRWAATAASRATRSSSARPPWLATPPTSERWSSAGRSTGGWPSRRSPARPRRRSRSTDPRRAITGSRWWFATPRRTSSSPGRPLRTSATGRTRRSRRSCRRLLLAPPWRRSVPGCGSRRSTTLAPSRPLLPRRWPRTRRPAPTCRRGSTTRVRWRRSGPRRQPPKRSDTATPGSSGVRT